MDKTIYLRTSSAGHKLIQQSAASAGVTINQWCLERLGLVYPPHAGVAGCQLETELLGQPDRTPQTTPTGSR